jgi:predicted NBD/HSP70 family sugar kinase
MPGTKKPAARHAPLKASTKPDVSGPHGAVELPSVTVDSYNLELRNHDGFIGDRASKRAFVDIVEDWRERLRRVSDDPLGDIKSDKISKKKFDELLAKGSPEAAGLIHGAIEEFANELALVIRKFLRTKGWQDTQRIIIGGGFRESRMGELAIGRAAVLLKAEGCNIDLLPVRFHPDDAGLLGAAQLTPAWTLTGHDALMAVDIGGTNIRAGILTLEHRNSPGLPKAEVHSSELWRHADDGPNRKQAVERLIAMLKGLLSKASSEKLKIAPFIGVGCPGIIEADGSIARGGQNLPGGNWESSRFNLANELQQAIPTIGNHETMIVIHNDAVVQGLSEAPYMQDVERWGVATIGTGLGNARFTNRPRAEDGAK